MIDAVMKQVSKRPAAASVLRWCARTAGLAACVFFGAFAFGEGLPEMRAGDVEGIPIVLMVTLALVGYLVAWWRESHGGLLMLASGAMLAASVALPGLFTDGDPDLAIALVFLGSLGAPGLLFMLSARSRSRVAAPGAFSGSGPGLGE